MKIAAAACTWAATLALSASLAQAAPAAVWRCGEQGRDYSDQPCPLGVALALDDERSQGQVTAALRAAAQEQRLATRLVRERERRERLALEQNALPGRLLARAAAPAAAPRPQARRQPPSDAGTWRAVAPASRRARD